VRALVRADAPGAILLDAHPGEEAPARAQLAVGPAVALLERPQRRFRVAHQHARVLPLGVELGRVRVGLIAVRKVDLDDVVRRARDQLRALAGIDHVIGGATTSASGPALARS